MWYLKMHAILALCGMTGVLLVTRFWPRNKRILMLLFNLCFLLVFSVKLLAFYLVYTILNYIGYVCLCRTETSRRLAFAGLIVLNVAAVASARIYGMTFSVQLVFTLGLIYNVLKVIDALYFAYYFGKEGRSGLIDYANYILFIPTFTSGPILKFRDFMADARQPYRMTPELFEANVKRIILGLFKKVVLVPPMWDVFYKVLKQPELHTHESLFLMIWFYILIYFDFSGYSDIAIGFGRMMGYTVPENFKRPFLSPTLTQYWRNWHATLGDWFRDHLFMLVSRRTPTRSMAAGLSVLIMVSIGLWHGFTPLYLGWGIYHGILLALENILQKTTVNKRKVSKAYFYFRVALVQLAVVAAVIVYSENNETVLRIYRGLLSLPSFSFLRVV
jgi:alginate O-acetyltransferase complex protein AlgI